MLQVRGWSFPTSKRRIQMIWGNKKFKTKISTSSIETFEEWKEECLWQKQVEEQKKSQQETSYQLRVRRIEFLSTSSLLDGIETIYSFHPDLKQKGTILCRTCCTNLTGEIRVTGAIFWNPGSLSNSYYPTLFILGYCIGEKSLNVPIYLFASPTLSSYITSMEEKNLTTKTPLRYVRGPFCRFCENQISEQLQPENIKKNPFATHLLLERLWKVKPISFE